MRMRRREENDSAENGRTEFKASCERNKVECAKQGVLTGAIGDICQGHHLEGVPRNRCQSRDTHSLCHCVCSDTLKRFVVLRRLCFKWERR